MFAQPALKKLGSIESFPVPETSGSGLRRACFLAAL